MMRILLVDDDALVLSRMSALLRLHKQDWATVTALGAHEARNRLAEDGPFDVVVCDVHMPGPDGGVLLEHVKEVYPHVGRIVLTGNALSESAARAATFSHRFLTKPVSTARLEEAIEGVVHDRRHSSFS